MNRQVPGTNKIAS